MGIDHYTPVIQTRSDKNLTRAEIGPLADLGRYEIEIPARKRHRKGKVFLQELLRLTGMEVSLTRLEPGAEVPFLHQHRTHEELYVFTSGRGQMLVDGEAFEVAEGSLVRVATGGSRSVRAAPEAALTYLCIQARQDSLPAAGVPLDGIKLEGAVPWPS